MASSNKSQYMTDELYNYILAITPKEPDAMRAVREATAERSDAGLQIAPEQGPFLSLLVRLVGAKRTLEIGVYTGYSSMWVAQALPEDGKITALDISEEFTSIARRNWEQAGIGDKIELRLGPAVDSLDALLAEGQAESYDFAFIDADKINYPAYYERVLQLIRPGGLIVLDNVIYHGRVLQPDQNDPFTMGIYALNETLASDDRVYVSVVPISDGMTLVLKK